MCGTLPKKAAPKYWSVSSLITVKITENIIHVWYSTKKLEHFWKTGSTKTRFGMKELQNCTLLLDAAKCLIYWASCNQSQHITVHSFEFRWLFVGGWWLTLLLSLYILLNKTPNWSKVYPSKILIETIFNSTCHHF